MLLVIILLAVVGVAIVAIGWHLRWFSLATHQDDTKPNVTVTLDKHKIEADKNKVLGKIEPASKPDHT